jgi:hypothetical protein
MLAGKANRAVQSGNPFCGQPREKNNPAKGKGGKGLRISSCKKPKKIWFASPIPGTLFESSKAFLCFSEEIVLRALVVVAGASTA